VIAKSAMAEKITGGKAGAARRTTSTSGSFDAASSACGTTDTADRLTAMYSTVTHAIAITTARGNVRRGSFTSSTTWIMSSKPMKE